MPTPHDDTLDLSPNAYGLTAHTTCPPPESERVGARRARDGFFSDRNVLSEDHRLQGSAPVVQPPESPRIMDMDIVKEPEAESRIEDVVQEAFSTDGSSPMTIQADVKDGRDCSSPFRTPPVRATSFLSSCNYEFSEVRQIPNHTSSFLRAGSKFQGTQTSDKQTYKVDVDIKHVDMDESFVCGYLRIEGLTEDHPTLTTYFEGEIVGPKYTFLTKHESWGATDKTDMQHWARFPAWRPLAKQAKKPDFHYKNTTQRENIFMRWKEYFLVPDHRVREILGASFEGFYYICFNQVVGSVSGIYFHAKSEKYQQLELQHVNNMGCFASVEFR
ncbi:MAG: hypothetical protein MMC33_002166 [Icmadophila ericetorum]|nr:hypothetical protein [Icmadophila ericetorum]